MTPMSKIVVLVTNLLCGFTLVFGFYVIVHGHLTPGGGFQGGAVVASACALVVIAYGDKRVKERLSYDAFSAIEASGLIAFVGLGFFGLGATFFYNFLAVERISSLRWLFGAKALIGPNPGDINTGGVIPLLNLAVGTEVLGALSIVLLLMLMTYTPKRGEAEIEESTPGRRAQETGEKHETGGN